MTRLGSNNNANVLQCLNHQRSKYNIFHYQIHECGSASGLNSFSKTASSLLFILMIVRVSERLRLLPFRHVTRIDEGEFSQRGAGNGSVEELSRGPETPSNRAGQLLRHSRNLKQLIGEYNCSCFRCTQLGVNSDAFLRLLYKRHISAHWVTGTP